MERIQGTAGIAQLECINPDRNKWLIRLDIQPNTDPSTGVNYFERCVEHKPTIGDVKSFALACIIEYDNSPEVNKFFVNDSPMWFDKTTRSSIERLIRMAVAYNEPTIKLWSNTLPPQLFTIPVEVASDMSDQLEYYASQCYNNSREHERSVCKLNTIEEMLGYDIRQNYPTKLNFNVEIIINEQ